MSHEKLVRQHVPDQLRAKGEHIETRIATPAELPGLLWAKLREEIDELFEAVAAGAEDQIDEELADVMEVMDRISGMGGWLRSAATRMYRKREEKGRFTNIVMRMSDPVPMVLLCPKCGTKHVDCGIWATTRVHRSHLCAGCNHVWRPFAYPTVGVEADPR